MEHSSNTQLHTGHTAPAHASRYDIYATIHKALRAQMMDTLHAVGCVDVHDSTGLSAVCECVLELADICASHLGHENDFVHPAIEAARPGFSARIAGEHVEHLIAITQLRDSVSTLYASPRGAAQERAALALYRLMSLFVAENFAHMHFEETEHNQVLWAHYSDDELRALEGRIVATLPPAENMLIMRWIFPAMTPSERAEMLAGMRAAAPAQVVEAVLAVVQPHLSERDWTKLTRALAPAEVSA